MTNEKQLFIRLKALKIRYTKNPKEKDPWDLILLELDLKWLMTFYIKLPPHPKPNKGEIKNEARMYNYNPIIERLLISQKISATALQRSDDANVKK